ncbi:MAG: hypothetical protein QMD36_05890 [Candidatus Aenigmarchaeota archaeon]|nr:hypothetical protein [Candidatus Aenigmarchaeota archaeon]
MIPTKFKINTEDFKIYFDNNKKTHVCENISTGEKTNIGVLGILMQMGILKPIEQEKTTEEKIMSLSERISQLEDRMNDLMRNIDGILRKTEGRKIEPIETKIKEEKVEEKPKSEIKKRIMKKVLEQAEEEEEPEEEIEAEETNVEVESDEEIENWMEI